ncbi:cell division protein ZapE [Nitrosomonas sp. Nm33]|nr:cell division protein ZapE [Nitrosomonas sp. Nm33]
MPDLRRRMILLHKNGRSMAIFLFKRLCAKPLGPADYLTIREVNAALLPVTLDVVFTS